VDFEKALESLKTIKLTGGIFGKTTLLLVVMCICVATVTLKIGTWWFALILMIPLMSIVYYALKRCLDFAEKNPQAAIMDGAELLVHERIIHGTKEQQVIPIQEVTIDHPPPEIPDVEVTHEDPPPTPELDEISEDDGKEAS